MPDPRRKKVVLSRREFVVGLSFAAAAAAFARTHKDSKMPLAFSTLGCPAWDLAKILSFAAEHGFAAIELRGLQGNMDLPSHPSFSADHLDETKHRFATSGLKIACVSSSARMGEADQVKRSKEIVDTK